MSETFRFQPISMDEMILDYGGTIVTIAEDQSGLPLKNFVPHLIRVITHDDVTLLAFSDELIEES